MDINMNQMYAIKESELMSFHMASVLQIGENKLAQDIVDEIRGRKISQEGNFDNSADKTQLSGENNNERFANCASYSMGKPCLTGYADNCGDVPCRMLIAQSATVSGTL